MRNRLACRIAAALFLLAASGRSVPAQGGAAQGATLRGVVHAPGGAPVEGANVFLLETLEGAVTGPDGRFVIATRATGTVTLVARRIGYAALQRPVAPAERGALVVTLVPQAPALAPVRVQAGAYTAGDERGATLTALEVVTTPGATADVARAMQTLPGVQAVDEGTGLYVRGGDYAETKLLLDGAVMLVPFRYQQPAGTFVGTVDPFLLDGIFFSSGGFGARHGNALSAVASLRTLGRPTRPAATLGAGLAAVSASAALPLPRGAGLRLAANRHDTDLLFRLNGATRTYTPPPRGHDLSGSVAWDYRPSGQLKLFAIDRRSGLGMGVEDPSYSGSFDVRSHGSLAVATWRDVVGPLAPSLSVSTSGLAERQAFGAFRLRTGLRSTQLAGEAAWARGERLTMRAGGEWERLDADFEGSVPSADHDKAPGARTVVAASEGTGHRGALFAEADWRPTLRTRLVSGVRTDRSTLTGRRTVDPRLSAALTLREGAVLTAAWGIYHQVPDPLFFDPTLGVPGLPPMRASQLVLGAQVEGEGTEARVELYAKRYRDLAQMTRDNEVVGGGRGRSRGVDVFLKGRGPLGLTGRATVSVLGARRTDPHTGLDARAAFDVSSSVTAVVERGWGPRWRAGAAYRYATGRPFTPVTGAAPDTSGRAWVPAYGAPMSERLPAFHRADLSLSHLRALPLGLRGVFYVSLGNVFDRVNVHAYRYTSDYRERIPVRSIFNRAVYFGASLSTR